jgi:predicted amidohydrolase
MKIAVAQSRPIVGAVEGNLAGHQSLVDCAVRNGASLVVFPELSLTGYEPRLAASLAKMPDDRCFACLQATADQCEVSIAVGVPTHGRRLPRISTLVFRPASETRVYSKQYLHADERPFFEPGPKADGLIHADPTVALAICYELSIPIHSRRAIESGATVYIASVAKTARGVCDAHQILSQVTREYSIVAMMANCVGLLDGAECVGGSSAWSRKGNHLMQLQANDEGVIVLDYETEDVVTAILPKSCQ